MNFNTVIQMWAKCMLFDAAQYVPVAKVMMLPNQTIMLVGINCSTAYHTR